MLSLGKEWIVWEGTNEKVRRKAGTKKLRNILVSPLFVIFLILSFCGLLLIFSSSSYIAEKNFGNLFHYLQRQSMFVFIVLIIGSVIVRIPLLFWEKIAPGLLLLGAMMLALVLLIGGETDKIKGSHRWIRFGSFNLQPSELVKIATLLYLSGYLVRHKEQLRNSFAAFLRPVILVALVSGLIFIEPDLGGALILLMVTVGLMFLGGVNIFQFFVFIFVMASVAVMGIFTSEYRIRRLESLQSDLLSGSNMYDGNYQILQSLIAFAHGKFNGVGFGSGTQKMLYLPEVHTDFIFAILAEELGVIGSLFILGILSTLVYYIFQLAKHAVACNHMFAAFYAYGFGILIAFQSFINIAVTMRLLPTTGMTLPFISYGGSSFLTFGLGAAILLRAEYELCASKKPIKKKKRRTS